MTNQDSAPNETIQTGHRTGPIISTQTRITGAAMAVAVIVLFMLDYLSANGTLTWAEDLVMASLSLMPLVVAAIMLTVSRGFDGPIRKQWSLFGYGMLSVGVGNVIFIILFITSGSDPYPSVADFFTLFGYVLFAVAFYYSIIAYRGLLDIRLPLVIAGLVSAAAFALVFFTVIGPYVVFAPTEAQSTVTRIFNTIYPVLDAFVLLLPAITLGLLVSKLGAGRVAWSWWLVVAGAATLAVTDAIFAYTGYIGAGRTPIIDSGYAIAPLLIGIAILVARDVYRS